jgi:hypothetical protein
MNLVNLERLFLDIDMKLYPMLEKVVVHLKEIKEGMNKNDLSVSALIGENRHMAEPMIEMMNNINKFMDEYKEIKDTWGVTAPSSVLNDEK